MPEPVVAGVDIGSGAARAVAITRTGAVAAFASATYHEAAAPPGQADPAGWFEAALTALAGLGAEPTAVAFGGQAPTTVAASGERAFTLRHPAGAGTDSAGQHAAQAAWLRERFGRGTRPRQLWDWVAARLGARPGEQSVWPGSAPLPGFGDPVAAGSSLGETDGAGGLASGIVLGAGANDAFLAAWASGMDRPGKGFDPGGSTGGLGVVVRAAEHAEAAAFGMAAAVPGLAIVGGPAAALGGSLSWWSRITGQPIEALLGHAAVVPAGAFGVMVLPFFEGERAPRWDPALRAEIVGLRLEHGAGVVARALLEAGAYGLAHIARTLAAQGIGLDRLVCSGSPSRSPLWNAMKAAVLEVPVDVPSFPDMSAYGAALAAGAALGWWPRPGEGGAGDWPLPEMATVTPEPLAAYREGLERFIALGDEAAARPRLRSDGKGED
jgi:xylulokinase